MKENDNIPSGELYDPKNDRVKQGTEIVRVANTKLVASLLAVGVPLYDGDPKDPYGVPPFVRIKLKGGKFRTTYNFYPRSQDGRFKTAELIKGWKQNAKFRKENPEHPFSYCIALLLNLVALRDSHGRDDNFFYGYRVPMEEGMGLQLVVPGSKTEKELINQGFERV